ncbi:MAG: pseudouridine synthase [Bacteroidia bacterium]
MSRDSQGPRKTFSKGGSTDFNKRKSFSSSDKPKRSFGKREESSEKRPRKSFDDDNKKAFVKRSDGKYESTSPRKSFAERDGEKRTFKRREDGDRPSRSFGDREKKSFVKRSDGKYESSSPRKSFGERDGEKRSFAKREGRNDDRPRRSYGDDEKRPFAKREGRSDDRPRRNFDSETKKPYAKRDDGERPKKSFAEKKNFDKPYEPKLSKSERVVEKSKKAGPGKTSTQKNVSDDAIRLNRYVANAGICSRREADVLIATGVVTVNGKIVTEMGYKVNPTDVVTYGGVPIKNETKKYLILNKPKDYITTMDDPEERRTVMELIRKACKERLYPVGRLDRNTTGILLFTNDGDMTAKLTHPKFEVRKVYHVTLDKKMTTEDYRMLNEGVDLADGFIKPDAVEFVGTGKYELGVEIHSGKNRIVRRMFEHLGYEVVKLDRVAFAGLTKKDLPRGKYRFLTEKEISFLKMLG